MVRTCPATAVPGCISRPPGVRRSPAIVRVLLERNFPGSWFLDAAATTMLTEELASLGIAGGAVYDALVGAAARHHGLRLLTSDRRALRTYASLGLHAEFI